MKRTIIFFVALTIFYTFAYCDQRSRVELTDGSIINGEIVSITNGIYVISTAAFGEIQVEASKVYRIESADDPFVGMPVAPTVQSDIPVTSDIQPGIPVAPTIQSGNFSKSQINSIAQGLMSDPESAAIITSLASDPRIQEVIKDPYIQNAAKAGDIQALMKNEKFMGIVNNPNMQEAFRDLGHRVDPRR